MLSVALTLKTPPDDQLEEWAAAIREVDPLFDRDSAGIVQLSEVLAQLRHCREQEGLNQAQVAELMGTTQSAVSVLEAGNTDPRVSTLRRYAAAVGRVLSIHAGPEPINWSMFADITVSEEVRVVTSRTMRISVAPSNVEYHRFPSHQPATVVR